MKVARAAPVQFLPLQPRHEAQPWPGLDARHLLLFLDFHRKPLHVRILEVKGEALADEVEAWQVGRQCCRT